LGDEFSEQGRKSRHEVLINDHEGLDHPNAPFVIPQKQKVMAKLPIQVALGDFVITMVVSQMGQSAGPRFSMLWGNNFSDLESTERSWQGKNTLRIEIVPNDFRRRLTLV